MKRITNFCFILLLVLSISCNEEDNTKKFPENLELDETLSSGCLDKNLSFKSTENGYFEYVLNENSIEIKHFNLNAHCAAEWCFEMKIIENKIIIKEVDNAPNHARCNCSFNISTEIENIVIGLSYEIEIWNENMTELLDAKTIDT